MTVAQNILLITKDTLRQDDLPVYGNTYWATPNIDEIASAGTCFHRHYTAAPSTAMAVTAMFTGLSGHELERTRYIEVEQFAGPTLFDALNARGFEAHVVWPSFYERYAWRYSKVFPPSVQVHNIAGFIKFEENERKETSYEDDLFVQKSLARVHEIISGKRPVFLWVHLPGKLCARQSFGSDVDLFDRYVGDMRRSFKDHEIFISSDHGHMRMEKQITGYGFHVFEGNVRVPLITPKIGDHKRIDFPTSHTQLPELIETRTLKCLTYVYIDTKYYKQPHRILAIISGRFKYVFDKASREERLYDLEWDPNEDVDLLRLQDFDGDRLVGFDVASRYFYPFREEASVVFVLLRNERDRIWRSGAWYEEVPLSVALGIRSTLARLKRRISK